MGDTDPGPMKIASAASAYPPNYYPQAFLLEKLSAYWGEERCNPQLLARLHRNVGVEGRHLALPTEEYPAIQTWGEANDAWIRVAQEVGERALSQALARAQIEPHELGALFFTSVTGIASPSIDALLVNRMKLSTNLRRVPIFGLGCVAGAAGIARAADYVRAYPEQAAAVLAVELCSLTLQREDISVANMISAGLFADGAGAAVVTGAALQRSAPEILATKSIFYPGTEPMMGWKISEKGFNIVLSPEVPDLIRRKLGQDVDEFLAQHQLTRNQIESWVFHTGGPRVLEAIAESLALKNGELDASWQSLRRVGNLSSASVLVVLEEVMTNRRPAPGTFGILAAMGPGFCSELVLLRW